MKNLTYVIAIVTVMSLSFVGLSSFTTDKAPLETEETFNNVVFIYGVSPGKYGQETVWFPTEEKAIKYAKDMAYADGESNHKEGVYTLKKAMVSDLKLLMMKYNDTYIDY